MWLSEEPGVMCLSSEVTRSTAMATVDVCRWRGGGDYVEDGDGTDRKLEKWEWEWEWEGEEEERVESRLG